MNFLPQNMSILIADDLKTNRMLAKKTLSSEGYKIIEATNGIEAVEKARKYQPDLILIDGMMPKMTGFEAISLIKEFDELKEIPILMFTSLDNKKDKIKAFEAGANDYILKPFDEEDLILRVRSFLNMRYLFLENKKARIDTVYNMPNLQSLKDSIENCFNPTGIFFQIKDFERVVYLYGLVGSKIIVKDLISRINKSIKLKNNYEIFTISEDRFAIFWDNQDEIPIEKLNKFGEKFYNFVNGKVFGKLIFKTELKISVVVNSIKENFLQISLLLLKEADKKRPSYLVADIAYNKMVKEIEKTISMIEYINDAIKEDRVVPVYQPILDIKTNKIYKYECLVRIKKADGGLLSPAHFLETAKQSEQYSKITKIVIQKSFEYMSKQSPEIEFSINLSSLDIENSEMKSFLFQKLDEYQLHKRLIIELLEDESVNDFTVVVEFINKVKKMGVRIAIDDYGSGYSNLERVFQFQPDFLKIDGTIIQGICENNIKLAIAKSAVNLAKEIGIKTISEYISDKQIYNKAKEIDVDFLQGYYISEPKLEIGDIE
jgi:EAL domain-containing protein (putative c-di-GMP-specific phosphodiesterase class I)/DNA-binding response OmpR family regulator